MAVVGPPTGGGMNAAAATGGTGQPMPKKGKKKAVAGPPQAPSIDVDLEGQVKSHVTGVLSGAVKRYDDKTLSQMKQGIFEASKGQAAQSKRSLRSELAKSGTLRSGAYQRGLQDIDREASSQYTKGVRDIMMEKAKAEWEDKVKALDQAESYLKRKQDYDIGLKQIDATLESARIQAGATVQAAALGAEATKHAASASAGAARYSAQLNYDLGMQNVQLGRDRLSAGFLG